MSETAQASAAWVYDAVPDAAAQARRHVSAFLADASGVDPGDVALVVSELVSNAVFHGAPPVELHVAFRGDRLRVEVTDHGGQLPVMPRASLDALTGRGLALAAAVSAALGVEPRSGGGKVVWAELSADGAGSDGPAAEPPAIDIDTLLASWPEDPGEVRYEVQLGEVPTALLLEAKSHIDNVVRELALMRDAASRGAALPPALATLARTVTDDWADARQAIKRQALAALGRGERTTVLQLRLPLAAAAAGERYLAALDEVDRYARAARLLTLAPPAAHRIFRRWYVRGLIEQLHGAATGTPVEPPPHFTDVLAAEVTRLQGLDSAWSRLQLLQSVTADLADEHTVAELAATVCDRATASLGAESARVFLLDAEARTLRSVAMHGAADAARAERYAEISLDSQLPGAVVARTGRAQVYGDTATLERAVPELAGYYAGEHTLHVAPLTVAGRTFGVLSLAFPGEALERDAQTAFVQALADALAQAIDRAAAIERAERAAERLAFLADASIALSASLDFDQVTDAVARVMVPRLADWCVVQMVRDGGLATVAIRHGDPTKLAWAQDMTERYPTRMDDPTGAAMVIRTGVPEVYPDIPPDLVEASATDAEHLRTLRELGLRSALVVPLTGRSGQLGAITLIYAESGRRYSDDDIPFALDVARRAALALETAEAFQEQSGRLASVIRVAEAAQRAILAPPPARLGSVALAARYLSAAAEARIGGDLYEVVGRGDAVRLLIGDVRGKGLAAVRLATVVLGEFRGAAADLDDLADVARQIDRRLRPYLGPEDFVTALLAEVDRDGSFRLAGCGHPAPVLARGGRAEELVVPPGLPLGLGADPTLVAGQLRAGDRLLLYTDGLLDARDTGHRFVDLADVVAPVAHDADPGTALDAVLAALRARTGPHLGDDLALLVAQYQPAMGAGAGPPQP